MGFGILFIGYMLSISMYPGYTDFIAFGIIFYALIKLGVYNGFFRAAKISAFSVMIVGIGGLMIMMGKLIGFWEEWSVLIDFYDNVSECAKIVFHVLLLLGIRNISIKTDLGGYATTAVWLVAVDAIYACVFAASMYMPVLLPSRMLVRVVLMLSSAVLIFNCYRMICLEGDEDMPLFNSRFEFVNSFRRRLEQKAEEGNKKGSEAQEYKKRRMESRQNGVNVNRTIVQSKKKK